MTKEGSIYTYQRWRWKKYTRKACRPWVGGSDGHFKYPFGVLYFQHRCVQTRKAFGIMRVNQRQSSDKALRIIT